MCKEAKAGHMQRNKKPTTTTLLIKAVIRILFRKLPYVIFFLVLVAFTFMMRFSQRFNLISSNYFKPVGFAKGMIHLRYN